MVKSEAELRRIVAEYVNKLAEEINVKMVILYGSYANGTPAEWSDVDIAVIADDWGQMSWIEQMEFLARCRKGCSPLLEPLGYTIEEYEHALPLTFLGEIKRTGQVIWRATT